MKRPAKSLAAARLLRGRAEERLRRAEKIKAAALAGPAPADPLRLLHELQVHQIELELQNTELQCARERMETLLDKYTDLYDFAPVGYFSLNDRGVILEVNLTGAALLGIPRAQLLNRRLSQFVAATGQAAFLAFLARIFAGPGKQVGEVQVMKVGGAPFWAGLHGTKAMFDHGVGRWCRLSVTDVSPLKQTEEVLRRSRALFSALITQAPVGVYVVNAQFQLHQVNPKAQQIFGRIQPLLGRDFSEIVHLLWPQPVAAALVARFRHTLFTGVTYQALEFSERRRDTGVTEVYEWQIQRVTLPAGDFGVVCFFSDITARKAAEGDARRLEVLAASNRKLETEIVRRKTVERSLKQSEQHQKQLLEESHRMQERLRYLARQVLVAQEAERKEISRELHDEIAQSLVGINVHLENLSRGATIKPQALKGEIARTQKLVEQSVLLIHRFARDLRPTVLDDLGLLPALHAYLKEFTHRTKLHVKFSAYAGVEQLSNTRRTVLYRVAQSALTNIAQHAQASHIRARLTKVGPAIRMTIHDNGKSFEVARVLHAKRYQRLGLIGMRERVEMVGGSFSVTSAPGKGTTIRVQIPVGKPRTGGRQAQAAAKTKLSAPRQT